MLGKTIIVQSIENPSEQQILRGHSNRITCTAVQQNLLLSGESGHDSDVILWDLSQMKMLQRFSEHDDGINSVSFSPDGLFWCSVGTTGLICISELKTGDIVFKQYL